MDLHIGDFIISPASNKPSLIIQENCKSYLVTIDEYKGDYKWVDKYVCSNTNLKPEEELSILSNYGEWFYSNHKIIYQELIIKNLICYFKK